MDCKKKTDAVILTYRPGREFGDILEKLEGQHTPLNRIIVINTEKKYYDELSLEDKRLEAYDNVEVHHIKKEEFDHGGTRRYAATLSDADHLIYMTQDAVPVSDMLVDELIRPFEDETVAVTYARQIPKRDASPIERYNRSFNYPDEDIKKTKEDVERLGIKTYFCSDVCACYRKDIYQKLGGHIEKAVFNEDMIYACKAVNAGYGIYYASKALVYHSHDYSPMMQYKRNTDLGMSQAEHPEVFGNVSSVGEGKKLVKGCIGYLIKNGYWYRIPEFLAQCAGRYLGYRKGIRTVRKGQ